MHHPHSPHYQFDPSSPGWLRRKHEKSEPILAEEVIRIAEADPANFADSLVQHYMLRVAKRELMPRRGRKPGGVARAIKLTIADVMIEDRAAEIKDERRRNGRKHVRGDLEPCRQAAAEISALLGFNMTGPALLNAISKDALVI